ncbi:hypothetical protein CEN39_14525, partial [Fischerella thermalis CCMEE 5201]
KKFFQTLKDLLEKSHMSPTIGIAETHVSVHSSHHTPPGLLFRAVPYVEGQVKAANSRGN